ncbi:RNA polymerase sigma-70 factor [Pseudoflavitalea rhizosphaerae]|uniref:RNA polymerase sigma-70 factor n=1 Tax=Pseudoflavitalea rhizosphaerae TaxID=1884793 RepID=UPI0013DE965B|nr:RNA polymerase sigma-70 factor [Pseudoflavitalea rhizosphaerae]
MTTDQTYTDQDLLYQLRTGGEEGFEILWRNYYKRVLFFCRRYLPESEAQDITTEVFVALWNRRNELDSTGKISTYLFVAARNRCYNALRDHHSHTKHLEKFADLKDSDDNELFLEEVRVQLIQLINEQVNKLPAKTRQVFIMSFEQGLKPSEIAEKLGVSVKTVKNQKISAIKLLKSILQDHPLGAILVFLLEMEGFFN